MESYGLIPREEVNIRIRFEIFVKASGTFCLGVREESFKEVIGLNLHENLKRFSQLDWESKEKAISAMKPSERKFFIKAFQHNAFSEFDSLMNEADKLSDEIDRIEAEG